MLGFEHPHFNFRQKFKHDASPKASTSAMPEARDVTSQESLLPLRGAGS